MDGRDDVFLFPMTADNKPDVDATPRVRLRAELPSTALRFNTSTTDGIGSLRDPGNEPKRLPRSIDWYFIPRDE